MIGVIIQARTKSSRFPRKIYEDINGKITLYRVLEGVKKAQIPHKIILAMPKYDEQEFIGRYDSGEFNNAIDDRFALYFGSSDDLVDRYFQAAREYGLDLIIRVTADCPLVQGQIIDEMLTKYLKKEYNGYMACNELVSKNPLPDGCDVEIFPYWMLSETHQLTNDPIHREHVTPFMYRRGTEYNIYSFENKRPNTMISMHYPDFSFDTKEDLFIIKIIAYNYDKHEDLNRAIIETYNSGWVKPKPAPDSNGV
jgi:spore coat polysaccharide biosynthesis protein SpsF